MTWLLGFLTVLILHLVNHAQAQEGIGPIPPRELYGEPFNVEDVKVPECNPLNYNSASDYQTCWKASIFHKDYGCRYHKMFGPQCHCCGKYYHYIEHGPICTKFCLKEENEELGQDMILITLPFNWGWEVPDKITLDDGTELPVKCDILDGNNFGCNGDGNGGNRNDLPTIQLAANKPMRNKEKYKITPTARPLQKRTTTMSNHSKYQRTTLKTTNVPYTSKTRVQGKSMSTTRRTTTKRTTTQRTTTKRTTTKRTTTKRTTTKRTTTKRTTRNPIIGERVQFSFGRKKTTEFPKVFGSRIENISFKTTTISFRTKLNTRQSSTDEHVWTARNNKLRVPKATTLIDDRPVWG